MDLYCAKCGEPWDAYHVQQEWTKEERDAFIKGKGCDSCSWGERAPMEPSDIAKASGCVMEMCGDDLDGAAATMDDFIFAGLHEDFSASPTVIQRCEKRIRMKIPTSMGVKTIYAWPVRISGFEDFTFLLQRKKGRKLTLYAVSEYSTGYAICLNYLEEGECLRGAMRKLASVGKNKVQEKVLSSKILNYRKMDDLEFEPVKIY